jgi:hypothetical protein
VLPVVVPAPPAPVVPVVPEAPHSVLHLPLWQLTTAPWQFWHAGVAIDKQPWKQLMSLQPHALVQVMSGPHAPPERLPLCHPAP